MKILHPGFEFRILGCRDGEHIVGQGPDRVGLGGFQTFLVVQVPVPIEFGPYGSTQGHGFGRGLARCYVTDQTQTISVQLQGHKQRWGK